MKKYYVENGKIVINKYCVTYIYYINNDNLCTKSENTQYVANNDELNALTAELTEKGIDYTVTEIDTADILKYEGTNVSNEEEARMLIEPTLDELKAYKLKEISEICKKTIYSGVDVTLSDESKKHFSLKPEDQMNLNRLAISFENEIPYHADGELCRMYSKNDFTAILNTTAAFISKETTYCNHLMAYVKSLDSADSIKEIIYGQELTGEFLESYNLLRAYS